MIGQGGSTYSRTTAVAVPSTADQNQMRLLLLLLGAGWRQQSNSFPPLRVFHPFVGWLHLERRDDEDETSIVTSISFTFFKSMEFWLIKTSLTTEMGGGCLMKRGPIVLKIP